MQSIQKILSQISYEANLNFPCIPEPGKVMDETGRMIGIITAQSQLYVSNKQDDDKEIWSPTFYQNCMKPEIIKIYSLSISALDEKTIQLKTKYREAVINLEKTAIEVTSWEPGFKKNDCSHCTNCGRCSW